MATGCGTTKQTLATEQLLESDAVDAAIAAIDFAPLSGQKVFFEARFLQDYKGVGFVNSNYIISGLRQQMFAAGCLLQEKPEDAKLIVEGRIGALGSDKHDVVYGIPASNPISSVGSMIPGAPALPQVPELSMARKNDAQGAAKVAAFAYDRESRERVWQSGLSVALSESKDTWIFGAGPFQGGTIYRGRMRFAGSRLPLAFWRKKQVIAKPGAYNAYQRSALFKDPSSKLEATSPPALETPVAATAEPTPPAANPAEEPVILQVAAEEPQTEPAVDVTHAPEVLEPLPFPGSE